MEMEDDEIDAASWLAELDANIGAIDVEAARWGGTSSTPALV